MNFPESPFILLEEFVSENLESCGIHIISVKTGKTIMIGRAQEADLKISDISVSRKHAFIRYVNSKFFIFDNKSKFGTLAKMKKFVNLSLNKKISIQVGNTMFHISVKNKFCLKNCCFAIKKISPKLAYITQEGFEHNNLEISQVDSYTFNQSIHSISNLEN